MYIYWKTYLLKKICNIIYCKYENTKFISNIIYNYNRKKLIRFFDETSLEFLADISIRHTCQYFIKLATLSFLCIYFKVCFFSSNKCTAIYISNVYLIISLFSLKKERLLIISLFSREEKKEIIKYRLLIYIAVHLSGEFSLYNYVTRCDPMKIKCS